MSNDSDGGSNIKWVIGAVLVPILVACIGAGVFRVKDGCVPFFCGNAGSGAGQGQPADIFLSHTSGPGGSTVKVSGENFQPDEQIVIQFHTEEIGRTQANDAGRFANVTVTIPKSFSQFAPHQFDIIATGRSSISSARAAFTISG